MTWPMPYSYWVEKKGTRAQVFCLKRDSDHLLAGAGSYCTTKTSGKGERDSVSGLHLKFKKRDSFFNYNHRIQNDLNAQSILSKNIDLCYIYLEFILMSCTIYAYIYIPFSKLLILSADVRRDQSFLTRGNFAPEGPLAVSGDILVITFVYEGWTLLAPVG